MNIQACRSAAREQLGFAESVRKHIEPVLVPHGFRRTDQSCYVVMYESAKVFLQVIHDPRSYGIGMEFWRLAEPSERCTLGGLLASEGAYQSFQASTPDRVNTAIVELAALLKRHATEVLSGDHGTYRRLVKDAEARSEAYTKEVVQQPIRTAAHAAWKRRDYAKVCELYASLDADSTPVERKRLDYAESHSDSTENAGAAHPLEYAPATTPRRLAERLPRSDDHFIIQDVRRSRRSPAGLVAFFVSLIFSPVAVGACLPLIGFPSLPEFIGLIVVTVLVPLGAVAYLLMFPQRGLVWALVGLAISVVGWGGVIFLYQVMRNLPSFVPWAGL